MDPVTTAILAVIAAGAATEVTEVSKHFVDAYASLKDLLRPTFSQDSPLIETVEKLEQNPDSRGRKAHSRKK